MKLLYKLPIIGTIIKDRDKVIEERDILLQKINNKNIKFNHNKYMSGITKYLKNKEYIFDIGTGPNGSHWWNEIDTNSKIIGIDLYFFPKKINNNISIYKYDASQLHNIKNNYYLYKKVGNKFIKEKTNLLNKFDLIVANHVLEHVNNPSNLIKGIYKLLKKGGKVYIGFPDCRNFTDIFYHIVHPNGGGHIQFLTDEIVINYFITNKFKLIEKNIWPDDWNWFQTCYDPKLHNLKYITQSQINYLCNVFRKELTPKKGYFYGWEMVFQKP